MTIFQTVILGGTLLLLAALLAGLVVRGGYRVCYAFPAYALAVLATNLAVLLEPSLNVWGFWLASEVLHAVLRFLLAAELGWRIFAALPGARATLAAALLFVSLVTLWAVLGAPLAASADVVAQTALARVLQGTAWILGGLLAAKLYYRIPVHPLHQAILRGLVPVLLIFTVALSLLETFGWNVRLQANYLYGVAYLAMLLYWNKVAWSKAEDPRVPLDVVRSLQPWRKI